MSSIVVAVLCRLEKEKNQQKSELEELRGQVEHLIKAKVSFEFCEIM